MYSQSTEFRNPNLGNLQPPEVAQSGAIAPFVTPGGSHARHAFGGRRGLGFCLFHIRAIDVLVSESNFSSTFDIANSGIDSVMACCLHLSQYYIKLRIRSPKIQRLHSLFILTSICFSCFSDLIFLSGGPVAAARPSVVVQAGPVARLAPRQGESTNLRFRKHIGCGYP